MICSTYVVQFIIFTQMYVYIIIIIKLRRALFVTYTIIQSITSSEMCSLYLTHPRAHTLEQLYIYIYIIIILMTLPLPKNVGHLINNK